MRESRILSGLARQEACLARFWVELMPGSVKVSLTALLTARGAEAPIMDAETQVQYDDQSAARVQVGMLALFPLQPSPDHFLEGQSDEKTSDSCYCTGNLW